MKMNWRVFLRWPILELTFFLTSLFRRRKERFHYCALHVDEDGNKITYIDGKEMEAKDENKQA